MITRLYVWAMTRFSHWWQTRPGTQTTPLRLAFRRPWPGTRRGLILWFFGWAFAFYGIVNYVGTTIPHPTRDYLAFALSLAPQQVFGWLFVVVGLLAVGSAYCHFNRDRWGYKATALLAGAWGLDYVCGTLFFDAGLRALGASVLWFLYAAILTICAGLPKLPASFVGHQ